MMRHLLLKRNESRVRRKILLIKKIDRLFALVLFQRRKRNKRNKKSKMVYNSFDQTQPLTYWLNNKSSLVKNDKDAMIDALVSATLWILNDSNWVVDGEISAVKIASALDITVETVRVVLQFNAFNEFRHLMVSDEQTDDENENPC